MSNEQERPKATTDGHALAMGRFYVDRDPVKLLKEMNAAVCYSPGIGYYIALGKDQNSYMFNRLTECIAFNEGKEL